MSYAQLATKRVTVPITIVLASFLLQPAAAQEVQCGTVSAGAMQDATAENLVNVGQAIIGTATNGSVTMDAGVIPCLSEGGGGGFSIVWTGLGDAVSWADVDNWQPMRLPGPGDDVGIPDVAQTVEVVYAAAAGSTNVDSLVSSEPVRITGGILTLDEASIFDARLTMTFGTLNGAGDITLNGELILSGGILGGTGEMMAAAGMTINGFVLMQDARSLVNPIGQTANFAGGSPWLRMRGTATFDNRGTFNASSDGPIERLAESPMFINSGTFNKTSPGLMIVSIAFDNSNVIDVQAGTLRFTGDGLSNTASLIGRTGSTIELSNGTHTFSAESTLQGDVIEFTSGNTTAIEGTYRAITRTRIGGGAVMFLPSADMQGVGQQLVINGGVVNFDSGENIVVDEYTQTFGTLDGVVDVLAGAAMTFSGGIIRGTGTMTCDGGTTISGFVQMLDDRRFVNQAEQTVTFVDSAWLRMRHSAVFENRGTFDAQSDGPIERLGESPRFLNGGTFSNSGPGRMTITIAFENSGEVRVSNGSLRFSGVGLTSTADVIGGLDGTIELFSGTHTFSEISTLTAESVVFGSGNNTTIDGLYDVSGTTQITGGAVLFRPVATMPSVGDQLLINGGTITFDSGDDIAVTTYTQTFGTLDGTVDVSVTGLTTLSGGVMRGTGIITAGGGMVIDGFVHLMDDRTVFNPAGQTATFTGAAWLRMQHNALFENLGTFDADGDGPIELLAETPLFKNSGVFNRNGGGDMRITVAFDNSNEINLNNGTLIFSGVGLNHEGVLIGQPGAVLELGVGSHIIAAQATVQVDQVVFSSSNATSIRGSFDVATRTEIRGGNLVFEPSANLVSLGTTLEVGGGIAEFNSGENIIVDVYLQTFGSLLGTFDLTANTAMTLSGGTMGGIGTTTAGGGMTIDGFVQLQDDRVVVNPIGQTTLFTGQSAWLRMRHNAVFDNRGTFDAQSDGPIERLGEMPLFRNSGTFNKLGPGDMPVRTLFENSGTIDIQNGIFALTNDFAQSGGATLLNGGDIVKTGSPMQIHGGLIAGDGTITGDVDNVGGRVAPGRTGIGDITVDGDYTQDSIGRENGVLRIDLAGTNVGEFDTLHVTGDTALAGRLRVRPINGFEPAIGDRFTILTCDGTITGTFDRVIVRDLPFGSVFEVFYNPNSVDIEIIDQRLKSDIGP